MAPVAISRTQTGHAAMIEKNKHEALSFNYDRFGPSQDSIEKLRARMQTARDEGKQVSAAGNMIYSGHCGFASTFYSSKRD